MVNVKFINDERLGRWKNQLNRRHATPIVLVGVGHDHNSGEVTVLCTEERTDDELITLLEGAAQKLRNKIQSN